MATRDELKGDLLSDIDNVIAEDRELTEEDVETLSEATGIGEEDLSERIAQIDAAGDEADED
jgi:hypothetical protein